MAHADDILAAQRALVEDEDLRDELGISDAGPNDRAPADALQRHRDARGRLTHPDDDTVYACPSCDDSNPRLRRGDNVTAVPSAPCYCGTCGTGFGPAALVVREPGARGPAPGTGGRPPAACEDDLVTDGGTVTCCPRCDSTNIRCNAGGVAFGGEPAADRWTCQDCSHGFAEPRERDDEGESGHCRHGAAKALLDADADDLVTDGGVRYEPTDASLTAGDVVVDLASGQALQVVSVATQPAGEHPQTRSDGTAAMFDAAPEEPVYNCVFLPDGEKISPPTKTYAYPESRLLRYPVERATDGVGLQTHLRAAMLTQLCAATADEGEVDVVVGLARRAFGDQVADLLAAHGLEVDT
ncbi:hypothetical protein [Haloglomus litoreum]|uniref:hypothetical protein n=1 Tax=Haloglomus litoreum TaxID=3034026 RepID=UPI0023E8205D|nr:hypothetical protein [Haloglomus sp. DT116]